MSKGVSDGYWTNRLQGVIPGGAHTYSRGDDQFSRGAPEIASRGKGTWLYSGRKKWLDFGMGLRSVGVGYAEATIDKAARRGYLLGNSLTRPSFIELEAAEAFLGQLRSAGDQMVKFAKNGSNAVSAGVKLARAYTGRDLVAVCSDHPFFSFDDWFIGSTPMSRGVPNQIRSLTKTFNYGDIGSVERLFAKYPERIAVLVMEPFTNLCPHGSQQFECCEVLFRGSGVSHSNFLKEVELLCRKNGTLFLLDETITGNRFGLGGTSAAFGTRPDLRVFGKAIANGYSVAALVGGTDVMNICGISSLTEERVFILSATHGAEMGPLAALIATGNFYVANNVPTSVADSGSHLKRILFSLTNDLGLQEHIQISGPNAAPLITFKDSPEVSAIEKRSLFMQLTAERGLLIPWISIAYRHSPRKIEIAGKILEDALEEFSQNILRWDAEKWSQVKRLKPVFRKWN